MAALVVAFKGEVTGRVALLALAGARIRMAAGAGRRRLSSRSESASSFFMIWAFSHFSARLGLRGNSIAASASTTTASAASTSTTPVDEMSIMDRSSRRVVEVGLQSTYCALTGGRGDRLPRLLNQLRYSPRRKPLWGGVQTQ